MDAHQKWVRPSDGRLLPLVLQTAQDPHVLPQTSKWTRMGKPAQRVPPLLRVSYWIASSMFEPGQLKTRYTIPSLALTAVKLVVAFPMLCILVTGFDHFNLGMRTDDGLHLDKRYDTVRWSTASGLDPAPSDLSAPSQRQNLHPNPQGQASSAPLGQSPADNIGLNPLTGSSPPHSQSTNALTTNDDRRNGGPSALIRPRYLCFVKDFEDNTFETVKVSDYLEQHGDDVDLEFVFVSYTRMQFRVATEEEITNFNYPDEETREANKQLAQRDRQELIRWGIDAAKRAGKRAFWLDFECVRNDDGLARSTSSSDDVYRICDIVRAAHSMIIAIGPSASDKIAAILAGEDPPPFARENVTPWLRQWGSRLWTLPELLLCPAEYRIQLYVSGDPSEPKAMAKRNFAERAWDDADAVKELVDHFEGSATLSQMHFIESALQCFSRRKTDQFSQGDIAYATMGLFPSRQRPTVDKGDSGFQAFAKLSLANDNGAFLERLICLAPPLDAPWHETADRWGVQLSEIHPTNHVSGVLASDTLMLDSVYGATIRWDNLDAEPAFSADSKHLFQASFVPNFFAVALIRMTCFVFIQLPIATNGSDFGFDMAKWMFIVAVIFAPITTLVLIFFKRHACKPLKPRLIGVEGRADSATVEKYLWGYNHGRLEDVTPQSYQDAPGQSQTTSTVQPEFSFTLIDTGAMTITYLRSHLPPVAMLMCGEESGMQRAVLCSYDWRKRTFHRQTTLRLARRSLDEMHRIDNLRFSLGSQQAAIPQNSATSGANAQADVEAGATTPKEPAKDNSRMWISELIFLYLCIVTFALSPLLQNDRDIYDRLVYNSCFVVGVLIALLLLLRIPLVRVLRYSTMVQGFIQIAAMVMARRSPKNAIYILGLAGFNVGVLFSSLIVFMWSWYSPSQVSLRLLIWGVIGRQVYFMLANCPSTESCLILIFFGAANTSFLYLIPSTIPRDVIGRPMEIAWLAPHQRTSIARRAITHKFTSNGAEGLQQRQQSLLYRISLPFLLFCLSLVTALTVERTLSAGDRELQDRLGMIVVVLLVAVIMTKVPSFLLGIMIYCSVLATFVAPYYRDLSGSSQGFVLHILTNLDELVLPLIWSFIVHKASTWHEALGILSVSLIGMAVGNVLPEFSGHAFLVVIIVSKVILWGLLWAVIRYCP
ncbi:hypothetical protein FDECE_4361 [Fusarium decemcellulare]|nr:hypothetical protein FDECE_4361 [Fusarium decemcellulare]